MKWVLIVVEGRWVCAVCYCEPPMHATAAHVHRAAATGQPDPYLIDDAPRLG